MIYITGDTHGDYDIKKFETIRSKVTPADYIIICGDFGVYWNWSNDFLEEEDDTAYYADKKLKEFYSSFPCTILWVDGNHENFELIDKLPIEQKFNGYVHKCWSNCYHLIRGQTYVIDGITIFAFGGAESLDKMSRIPYVSWWEREMPNEAEMQTGLANLDSFGGKVDIILTHDAPAWWCEEYYNCPHINTLNKYFDHIYQTYEWGWWFFGHHHVDECFFDNLLCGVYNKFVTVKNVNGHITFNLASL